MAVEPFNHADSIIVVAQLYKNVRREAISLTKSKKELTYNRWTDVKSYIQSEPHSVCLSNPFS